MISVTQSGLSRRRAAWAALWMVLLLPPPAPGASISEPATVFYGKIWAAGGSEPYLAYDGQLAWTIQRADGTTLTLQTTLRPLNHGEFSYRLDVPHEALAFGVTPSLATVPLAAASQTHAHLHMAVDEWTALPLGPSGPAFDVAQVRRAATHRLDLVIGLEAVDADGNGLPDWWESLYEMNDPLADQDGDGLTNLGEYQRRADPYRDDRAPTLQTRNLRAHAGGTTVVRLQALDADSAPDQLVYTLQAAPAAGALSLRNATSDPAAPDRLLVAGNTFSQADLLRGRLVLVLEPAASQAHDTSFEVALRDENPAHPPSIGQVSVSIYHVPSSLSGFSLAEAGSRWPKLDGIPASEAPLVTGHLLAEEMGYVAVDSYSEGASQQMAVPSSDLNLADYQTQYLPSYGPDRSHVLLGGLGADQIEGGMEDDVLIGSRGNDRLRGNGGADLFVLAAPEDGHDVIEDFAPSESDVIDLSGALTGASPWLTNYVQWIAAGADSVLRINPVGTGPTGATLALTLTGVAASSLSDLVEGGHVRTGDKVIAPRLTLVASQRTASENGQKRGLFTLTRTGPTASSLTVRLQVTGSAANGVDYYYVSPDVTFLPGERDLNIEVIPYIDAITELSEVVQISLLAGDGYVVGSPSTDQVAIEDLLPQIAVEVLEPIAVKSDLAPGLLLVTRGAVLDRSVLVRLNVSGTAGASDYTGVPSFVNLASGQTTAFITVTPTPNAALSNGVEYVQVAIRLDPTYAVASPSSGRILLIEELFTLGVWRDRYFSGTTGDLLAFANADPGATGIRNLQRYAFGLDAVAPQPSEGLPHYAIVEDHLTVTYRRPVSVTDVSYAVEVSNDLVTWHASDQEVEPITAPDAAGNIERVGYRSKRPVSQTNWLFMRVRVTYAP